MNMETFGRILEQDFLGNTLRAYGEAIILLLAIVLGLWLFEKIIVSRLHALAERTETKIDDQLVGLLKRIGIPVYVFIGFYLATRSLALSSSADRIIRIAFVVFLTVKAIQFIQAAILYFIDQAYGRVREGDPTRATVIRNMGLVVQVTLWLAGFIFVLDNMGIRITGLVAGLGIGGIAVALAAQTVLEDAFSSFAIFLDRPFEVGDFVIVGDLLGVVENVGFKTTRIRSLHGEQLIFSNKDLTSSRIRNYKRMRERRIAFTIGAVYQTPLAKMQKIPGMIEEIIRGIEKARFDRAHFKAFGDFSLDIEIVYYVLSPDYNTYMDAQQEINLKIMEAFEREEIEFAYPTQTLFVERGPAEEGAP